MNISKKQWVMIAVGVGALLAIYWFFFRKKKESSYDPNVMIFGNESGYDAAEVGPGIESGYLVRCKKDEIEDICTKKEITNAGAPNEALVTTTYKCCVPNLSAARSSKNRYSRARAESGYRTNNPNAICKDSKGNVIPCKPIAPEDVIDRVRQE